MNLTLVFLVFLITIHVFAGLLHGDISTLACGLIYWLLVPSCFIFLQLYMIANINDVSWGTRSGVVVKKESSPSILTYVKEMEIVGLREIIRTIWYGPDRSSTTVKQTSLQQSSDDFVPEGDQSESTQSEGITSVNMIYYIAVIAS